MCEGMEISSTLFGRYKTNQNVSIVSAEFSFKGW